MKTPYIGNGPYCYANAASMLLASIEERISPALIEVLTGVGLGAEWIEGEKLIFFSNRSSPPDVGVSRALDLLGFACTERSSPEPERAPFETLRADLAASPALLGPLDMGHLSYNPNHAFLGGADHFVLAEAMDDQQVHLHDPEGFPCVSLSLDQLQTAWKAERIPYRRDFYRYWTAPRRIHRPAEATVYRRALESFKGCYRDAAALATKQHKIVGRETILACADYVRGGAVSDPARGHMVYFALKLGARRALDFAAFFDAGDPELAKRKREQAALFGKCHSLAVAGEWAALATALQQLADAEETFRSILLARW